MEVSAIMLTVVLHLTICKTIQNRPNSNIYMNGEVPYSSLFVHSMYDFLSTPTQAA